MAIIRMLSVAGHITTSPSVRFRSLGPLNLGCVVVGPVGKLDAALGLANDEALDAAILDVTIRGGDTFPVAERLQARASRSRWQVATATGRCRTPTGTSPA